MDIQQEITRRRTLAIISHPDAGKTTLTEKLLLYSGAIRSAGNVMVGKHKATVSDWMTIEQQRGISVSSSAARVEYDGYILNILDTPGHQDFSEDTYRTLMAVDSAIMLLDAAKGVEEQTIKLFKVCRDRGIPIITFINKLDRPALNPFELLDNVEKVLGITAIPMTWPVGDGADFRGVYERASKQFHFFERTTGGMFKAPLQLVDIHSEQIRALLGEVPHAKLIEDLELLDTALPEFTQADFLAERITPVFFGSAITNFGVETFLQRLIELAPPPQGMQTSLGFVEPSASFFSGFMYKIQANMNKAHRDRIAFFRIVSGKFERGMAAYHMRSGKEVKLNYPFQIFGQDRSVIDEAFPGDVIGLSNPGIFRVGDVLSSGPNFKIPQFPRFAPEIFAKVVPKAGSFSKSFRKGVEQLGEEGVIQIFSDVHGSPTPLVAAIGELQLEVFQARMESEYNEPVHLERLPFTRTRWLGSDVLPASSSLTYAFDTHGHKVVLFRSDWEIQYYIEQTQGLILLERPPEETLA
ncbi:MAG: peptide chain release factor 3 [Bacteroidota bacterium]|nr:peptide chain release factor 3 [Candidatus Kapabacteria bacterium]MDW8220497.1 peptide chain release factor 3 [Bacteroidota bacterium]